MAKRNPKLLLLFIDEYNTSQVCSKCNAHEIRLEHLHEKGDDGPARKGSKIWAVQLCPVCGTVWDRDVNASRNIRDVGLYMIKHNGERPYAFKRPPAKLQGDRVQAADSDAVSGTKDNR
ncbi:Acyl-CoA-binding domain-containing protein 5 [Quaeritorhiza haematococci]|nr:Acyl-CoA-binding domain-containing protein 5 [Quaeritorhiza haematococci]